MAVPAAAIPAAAGLQADVHGPVVTIRVGADVGPGSLAAVGSALRDVLRRLTGDVRVAIVRPGSVTSPSIFASTAFTRPAHASDRSPASPAELIGGYQQWRAALDGLADRADLISVAVVAGQTGDVGTALAAACDLRIFTADAGLCPVWAHAGLLPAAGALPRLVELAGWPAALDMCLTGRPLGAAEAARLGLAERVVPPARLEAELDAVVTGLLTPPRAVTAEVKALAKLSRRASPPPPRLLPAAEAQAWDRLVAGLADADHGAAG
ncbi:enoyl-CoA hydratase/isomerase family protein [Frankia sp. AgB32]|uniref:enoyl-CoA hydratase/isomerase family protein n=1 Tax=Frankia sp. AgB32 TaxID=631119 RepID=UPI00200DD628|nr:enoyl-CoA hydratase/isomerase family protein [Frankia sp. AgB32]MCK9894871.1 enoyl-CoA hydratase/isomerase family protein [Frankia sp. AgB32]